MYLYAVALLLATPSTICGMEKAEQKVAMSDQERKDERSLALAARHFGESMIAAKTIEELRLIAATNTERDFRKRAFGFQDDRTNGTLLHLFITQRPCVYVTELFSYGGGSALDIPRLLDGATPLLAALQQGVGHIPVLFVQDHQSRVINIRENVELLIKSNADVTIANNEGISPLTAAVQQSDLSIVRELLGAKADPLVKHQDGKSALDYAQSVVDSQFLGRNLPLGKERASILALLKSYQPKQ